MAPEKTDCPVVIYTSHHRIEGTIVLLKGERLSDKMNVAERKFEAIENARVFAITNGALVHESAYLAVSTDHITIILPAE